MTKLSPYITHGIVRTPELVKILLERYTPEQVDSLLKELVWKEYFTQVQVFQGDNILHDMEADKTEIAKMSYFPPELESASTGRVWLDGIIRKMQTIGYLHNHERMWLASYLTHFARLHWRSLADWTHYYFLDGDIAVNHLSWQWVSSNFSSKPYYFTSDNIEKYAGVRADELIGSYEDVWARIIDPRRTLPFLPTEGSPVSTAPALTTDLSAFPLVSVLEGRHILVLTPWSLDSALVEKFTLEFPEESRVYLILDE